LIRQEQEEVKKFNIQALNEDAKEPADKAENIILEGASLEPTTTGGIDSLPITPLNLS